MKLFGSKQKGMSAFVNRIAKAEAGIQRGENGAARYELEGGTGKPRSQAQDAAIRKAQKASVEKRKISGGPPTLGKGISLMNKGKGLL